jgi:Zn-finger nucleic acid-binding protein
MISCPSCRCEMRVCVERGIELDVCDSCNGVWLDAGELTKLSELSKDEESRRCSWTIPTNQESPLTTLHCSRCSDTLLVKVIIKHHAFQGCRICNGLFIDSGTLDSITSTGDDKEESKMTASIAEGILDALSALLFW